MGDLDFVSLFRFSINPLEIIVRGTAVYWFLFVLFRFVLRRDVGSIAIADILLLVMIADAFQNAMAGDYKSVSDGILLVVTLASWNLLLDWASYRFPSVRRFIEAKPLQLIRNGKILRANMRKEFITQDELDSKLRQQGISSVEDVVEAYLESDGEISFLVEGKGQGKQREEKGQDMES